MGVESSKNKNILQALENSTNSPSTKGQENLKIDYKINFDKLKEDEEKEKNIKDDSEDSISPDPFDFDLEYESSLILEKTKSNVKNIKKYPYCSIGTVSVNFQDFVETFEYACFLIDSNVVVTLASNLDNSSKVGKAI